jgi:hypothetical protein
MSIDGPKKPEDLLNQVDPVASGKEEVPGQQEGSEKKCPYCNGVKSAGTPTECQMCGGTGLYSTYAMKNL